MIDLLYQTLIFSGLIIFAVLFYLKHMVTRFLRVLTEIIRMNEMNEYDPVKFTEHLDPLMKKLGVKDYSYYIYFLETEYQKIGTHGRNSIKKFVSTQDFTVYVEISPGILRWERAYLGVLLVETIFLLIKIDVTLNLRATSKAMSEFNKINTFLTHDIKNLAQFINIMEHNLGQSLSDEKKDKLFGYLKSTAPSLKLKADKVLDALTESTKQHAVYKELIAPYEIADNVASILNIEIDHDTNYKKYFFEKKSLIIIFENIIKNFYDKSIIEPTIKLNMSVIEEDDNLTITFSDNGTKIQNCEKIFEPFYSEKKGGLGVGLYHCRNIATNMQGKLWAENTEEGPAFILNLQINR
ncbi:MAG: hypothetical protein C0603_13020 [Denitrovibrio sp.]|nr:MAG: hypothetical protein C0603_13020 [Denitrovibrio sp.]